MVAIGVGFYFISLNSHSNTSTAPNSEPERGGLPAVSLIDPNKTLYSSLTIDYYQAIKQNLALFISYEHGNPYDTVTVNNVKVPVNGEDTTTFTATIPSLKKSYEIFVIIPLDVNVSPTFSVPTAKYTSPLNV
jgi:hypothetical protein